MEEVKYFAFDKIKDMVYYKEQFEQTLILIAVLVVIYGIVKIFLMFDEL